jgi:hypothetical protein
MPNLPVALDKLGRCVDFRFAILDLLLELGIRVCSEEF